MNIPINKKRNAFICLVDRDMKNKGKCTCYSIDIWLILDDSVRNPIQRKSYLSKRNHPLCFLDAEGALISQIKEVDLNVQIHTECRDFYTLLSDKDLERIFKDSLEAIELGSLLAKLSKTLQIL